jgi:iron complex outermembrane receptor protein/hemoglobin/transferrin/lactoferrin receptor protein
VDNDALTGTLVPDYRTHTLAAMAFEEARLLSNGEGGFHRLILSAGARLDVHTLSVFRSTTVTTDYRALTGAVGAVVRLRESLAVAASLGRGWRPPSAFELHAHGVHGGVAAFQVGYPALTRESNVNADLSLRYRGRRGQFAASYYRNDFDRYIHIADSGRTEGALPIFVHRQSDATLTGFELSAEASPASWLKLTMAGTVADTRNRDTDRLLPQTPADRLLVGAQVLRDRLGPVRLAYAGIEASFVGRGAVSGPDEPFGTPTRGYDVYDLRAGFTRPAGPTSVEVALAVRNLFDREYRDFLWSYKSYAPNPGRDVRVTATWRF